MSHSSAYPVIDLFAGPGGLGEGFAALTTPDQQHYVFRTALSIEKDPVARRTLRLRHFFRAFDPGTVPDDYYDYLSGVITSEQLYERYPVQAADAEQTAWECELGSEPHETVKARIIKALNGAEHWVLVGGPPCQAYSLIGRSRMKGRTDFEEDVRHILYREYLRILADHQPSMFVMENVVGLLTAKLHEEYVISSIIRDLKKPRYAIYGSNDEIGYTLYSLSQPGIRDESSNPSAFVVRAEKYGIPQARHRILIVGVRNDIGVTPDILEPSASPTVREIIGDLPPLRSSLSDTPDEESWISTLEEIREKSWFQHGRENGLACFTDAAEALLKRLRNRQLATSSCEYRQNDQIPDWWRDDRLTVLLSHEARSHMASDLHRYFYAALQAQIDGISPKLKDFPEDLLPDHTNVNRVKLSHNDKPVYAFADRFRVQLADSPATTITSHIAKDGHYFIHYDPSQCRSLTVREAARLQTFPDNYKFEGNRTAQYQQVGNAVPPLLAMKIAEIVYKVLSTADQQ